MCAACAFVPCDKDRALLLAENQFQHLFCAPPPMGLRVVLKPPKLTDIDQCAHIPVILIFVRLGIDGDLPVDRRVG